MKSRTIRTAVASVAAAGIMAVGAGSVASASGPTFPEPDERCKVPPALFQVAAIVDVDSLEGCGFFEDPNFHENRRANGTYNGNGLFSRIFG